LTVFTARRYKARHMPWKVCLSFRPSVCHTQSLVSKYSWL